MKHMSDMDTAEFRIPATEEEIIKWPKGESSNVNIEFGAVTHPGKKRPNNEDSYIIYQVGRYWRKLHTSLAPGELPENHEEMGYAMGVADGIGGQSGGEIASKMAIRVCINLVLNSPKWALKLDHPETREKEIEETRKR
ncbi:MAG TPA: hypothetical protein VFG11_04425, partial [Acidobacteriota bacterium]|nr:hypothetical protein [Acidobacteriota bacterium]